MTGTALLLACSLVCGFAWNGEAIVIARALAGVAAALMAPTAVDPDEHLPGGVPVGTRRLRAGRVSPALVLRPDSS